MFDQDTRLTTATQLIADLSRKVNSMEMQLRQFKPLLATLSEVVSPAAIRSATSVNADTTSGHKNSMKSAGFNEILKSQASLAVDVEQPESRIKQNSRRNSHSGVEAAERSVAVIDRDKRFLEAEKVELNKSLWAQIKNISTSNLYTRDCPKSQKSSWSSCLDIEGNSCKQPKTASTVRSLSKTKGKSAHSVLSELPSIPPVPSVVKPFNAMHQTPEKYPKSSQIEILMQSHPSEELKTLPFINITESDDAGDKNSASSFGSAMASVGSRSTASSKVADGVLEETACPNSSLASFTKKIFTQTASQSFLTVDSDMLSPPTLSKSAKSTTKKLLSAIADATSKPKYTEKGSIISELDLKNVTLDRALEADKISEMQNVTNILKYGLNPRSVLSATLELAIGLFYIAVAWLIPLQLGFGRDISLIFAVVLSAVYAFDTFVEAVTMHPSHPSLLTLPDPRLRDWQRVYFRGYFWIDLITVVPFEFLPVPDASYLVAIRLLRMYKLPRILANSPKFIAIRKNLETALGIGQSFSGIFPLMFALCVFLHVQTCAVFMVGRLGEFSNAAIAQVQFKSLGDQYTWALFNVRVSKTRFFLIDTAFIKAVGNTFPMTYKPTTTMEQLVVLVFIIVGAALYASIVGTISSFAMGMDASGRLYKQKMDELREYMEWKGLSNTIRRKVFRYYELKYRGKYFEESTLFRDMNASLRMEIAIHNCKKLIQKVEFLRRETGDGRDELFLGRIAAALSACYFVPGDIIITQGEIGIDMYFILSGTVDIIVNGETVAQFHAGAFFGEVALIANILRTASVQAASYCSLYRLTRADFVDISSEFLDMREHIEVIYEERMVNVKKEEEVRRKTISRI